MIFRFGQKLAGVAFISCLLLAGAVLVSPNSAPALAQAGSSAKPSLVTKPEETASPTVWTTALICTKISEAATKHNIPRASFARLIWTESRFDTKALSPKGAQGIAQFMPATAKERKLEDPYDPAQAIPASAALLADLRRAFGNFGLAAAAYNAGPGRVQRWLDRKSSLPFETRDYVAAITGQEAETFRNRENEVVDFSLRKGQSFDQACRNLPILRTRFKGVVASVPRSPWGVQVAGGFSRAKAQRAWARVRGKLGVAIGNSKPRLYRQKSLRGLKPRWAVRLGASNRTSAIALCKRVRSAGGFCLVRKN